MSALDELLSKSPSQTTDLDWAVISLETRSVVAERAAEELAALRRVFEAARKYITIVNNFCEQPGDEEEWLAALAEYDKCRAA